MSDFQPSPCFFSSVSLSSQEIVWYRIKATTTKTYQGWGGLWSRWGSVLVKCFGVCDVPSWIYGCFENTAPEGGFPVQALQAALPGLGVGTSAARHLPTEVLSTWHSCSAITRQDFPQCRQMGGILEQRSQTGDQMYFVRMHDNPNYMSHRWKLGDFMWY